MEIKSEDSINVLSWNSILMLEQFSPEEVVSWVSENWKSYTKRIGFAQLFHYNRLYLYSYDRQYQIVTWVKMYDILASKFGLDPNISIKDKIKFVRYKAFDEITK